MNQKDSPSTMGLLFASILQENKTNLFTRSDLGVKVSGDQIHIFKYLNSSKNAKKRDSLCDANLLKRKYNGVISAKSKKHISEKINLWYDSVALYNRRFKANHTIKKRKFVFITLTLPAAQAHTDKDIKRNLFVPFLDKLKYHYKINGYFWRAEAQLNNNIHFHIITDTYIPKDELSYFWNETIEKYGYISRFAEIHGHIKPPTTNIKVIENGKYTLRYVLKYATKESDTRSINGAVWGMSDNIRMLKPFIIPADETIKQEFKIFTEKQEKEPYITDHVISIKLKQQFLNTDNLPTLKAHYKDRLWKIYSLLYYDEQPFDSDPTLIIYQGLDTEEIKQISRMLN